MEEEFENGEAEYEKHIGSSKTGNKAGANLHRSINQISNTGKMCICCVSLNQFIY